MNGMMAYCGLDCRNCPIHLATLEQDKTRQQEMRISIARICKEKYGMDLRAEDIADCDGCRSNTGRIFPDRKGSYKLRILHRLCL